MSALDKVDRLAGRALRIVGLFAFLAPLLARGVIGQAFYYTGKAKLANPPVEFFSSLGIPFPEANAVFVAHLEHYGGMLLIAGLATRLVAFLLSSTMVVAILTAHREEVWNAARGIGDSTLVDLAAVAYLTIVVWLVFFGAGVVSLDALVLRAYRRWRGLPAGTEAATPA